MKLQQMKQSEMCFQLTRNVTWLKQLSGNQVCKSNPLAIVMLRNIY